MIMNSIFLIFKNQFIKFIYLFFILFLFSCAHSDSISFSSPSINGLSKSLRFYQKMIYAEEYVFLLETFYLKEHQEQINNRYENNLLKWLEKREVSKSLINSSSAVKKYLCPSAYRRKNISYRFSPEYMIYYRLQSNPCIYINSKDNVIYHSGQMEWGYETKNKRWIHLRKLDE